MNTQFYQLGLSAGYHSPTPDFRGHYGMHPEIEILYNHSGNMEICRSGKIEKLDPDSLFLFWGMIPYKIQNVSSLNSSFYFTFPLDFFAGDPLLQNIYGRLIRGVTLTSSEVILESKKCWMKWVQEIRGQGVLREAALSEMKGLLYRWDHALSLNSSIQVLNPVIDKNAFLIQKIFIYIHKNIGNSLNLETIARDLRLNSRTLRRHFTNLTGMTLRKYVLNYRMNQAAHMIKTTQQPASFIAEKLGFESSVSFYRNFKAYFGQPPDYFRNK